MIAVANLYQKKDYIVYLSKNCIDWIIIGSALVKDGLEAVCASGYLNHKICTLQLLLSSADKHIARMKNIYLSTSSRLNSPYFIISAYRLPIITPICSSSAILLMIFASVFVPFLEKCLLNICMAYVKGMSKKASDSVMAA